MLLLIQSTNNMKKPSSILIVFFACKVQLLAQTTQPTDSAPQILFELKRCGKMAI
jgi:hypothetical protein